MSDSLGLPDCMGREVRAVCEAGGAGRPAKELEAEARERLYRRQSRPGLCLSHVQG
jgi:hypothetical protein